MALTLVLALSLMTVPVLAADSGSAMVYVAPSKMTLEAGDTVTYTVSVKGGKGLTGLSFDLSLSGLSLDSYEIKCFGDGLFQEAITLDGVTATLAALAEKDSGVYTFYATGTDTTDGVTKSAWNVLTLTCKANQNIDNASGAVTLNNVMLYTTEVTISGDSRSAKEKDVDTSLENADHVPGDVKKDDKVNNKDVVLLMQYIKGKNTNNVQTEALDVNGDGKINNKDVVLLMQYIKGKNVVVY
jgi:PKD repeat protein